MVNAEGAIETLLNLMAVPAVFLTCFGGYYWYKGRKLGYENRVRVGKLLVMFGLILLVIVLILSFFILEYRLIKSPLKAWLSFLNISPQKYFHGFKQFA